MNSFNMRWFGESWGSDLNNALPAVPAPIGSPCYGCERPITASDSGVIVPVCDLMGSHDERPFHLGCFSRAMSAGVAAMRALLGGE